MNPMPKTQVVIWDGTPTAVVRRTDYDYMAELAVKALRCADHASTCKYSIPANLPCTCAMADLLGVDSNLVNPEAEVKVSARLGSCSGSMYEVQNCSSLEAARTEVLKYAISEGWTPPRWWQWQRWDDYWWRISKANRNFALDSLTKEELDRITQSNQLKHGLESRTVVYLFIAGLFSIGVVFIAGLWWIRTH